MRKRILRRGLVFLMIYLGLILLISFVKAHADTEFWSIEDVGKDKLKIELNVDGCISSFTVPKEKFIDRDDIMDSMFAKAEDRQRLGCR
jgi:hypothetical protein